MDRREFLKKLASIGMVSASSFILARPSKVFSALKPGARAPEFDLVALKGKLPHEMFDEGIKVLGGMKNFVSKGDLVVVKPNIGFNLEPELGATTNPLLVKRVVEHCLSAGAKRVYVFDNTASHWRKSYQNSGIEAAAKAGGALVVPAHAQRYFQSVNVPGGKVLKKTQVHEVLLNADKVINIPVLKNHGGAGMTCAMKNLMGVVWDRMYYHNNGLHQAIADFCLYHKPTLNIVDAYTVMVKNGPRGFSRGDLVLKKMQLIATDMVAIDTAAAKILGVNPNNIEYIHRAKLLGIGNNKLEELRIKRIVL